MKIYEIEYGETKVWGVCEVEGIYNLNDCEQGPYAGVVV